MLFDEGTQWKGYVDANNLPCGLGEVFYVSGNVWTWGTAYAWQGIPYGPVYRVRFGETINGTTNLLLTWSGNSHEQGKPWGVATYKVWWGENHGPYNQVACVDPTDKQGTYDNFNIDDCVWIGGGFQSLHWNESTNGIW